MLSLAKYKTMNIKVANSVIINTAGTRDSNDMKILKKNIRLSKTHTISEKVTNKKVNIKKRDIGDVTFSKTDKIPTAANTIVP